MEYMYAKAWCDAYRSRIRTEDAFYETHSLDWLHRTKMRMRRAKAFLAAFKSTKRAPIKRPA